MTMNRLVSSRAGKLAALAALATLSLTACGSDPTSASEPGWSPSPAAAPTRQASPAPRASFPLRAPAPRPTRSPKSSPTTTPNAATRRRSSTTRLAPVLASSRSTTACRLRWLRLRTQDRREGRRHRGRQGQGTLSGQPGVEPADGGRPGRLRIQHRRRRQARAECRGTRRDFQRHHQDLE